MIDETEHTCQFCYYEYFDGRAYPCSMCVCGEERKDMFMPKGRQNKRKTENSSEKPNNCTDCECTDDCTECREAEHGCKVEPQICSVNGRPYSECGSCEHFKCTADEPQTERSE